jgi:formate-dependent nitrite reductase cytochrome c552 subunit
MQFSDYPNGVFARVGYQRCQNCHIPLRENESIKAYVNNKIQHGCANCFDFSQLAEINHYDFAMLEVQAIPEPEETEVS